MSIQISEARPPYAQFFTRAEEDRTASIEAGHTVYKDVDYVAITPQGSKDKIERIAADWLQHIAKESAQERFDPQWLKYYRDAYAAYKEGRETPLNGSPISEWPVATPAQIKTLLGVGIRTVEDVASANEETISRLGMGGRALKDKAINWLQTSADVGKVSERITALEVENARLKADNEELTRNCATLNLQVQALQNAQAAVTVKGAKTAPSIGKTDDVEF